MSNLKLLFVEDTKYDMDACKATIKRYSHKNKREIELVEASKISEAFEKLDNTFDGAIIDLNLGTNESEGNTVIREIVSKYRIPIVVLTGEPTRVEPGIPNLGVFVKGETGYEELFDLFYLSYDTGITKILGGRGYIEEAMNRVFWNNILPVLDDWKTYKAQGKETETALLRHIVNHIAEIVDGDVQIYFPEEMYIIPPISTNLNTGSILLKKENEELFIVLSPACDLVPHNGSIKTDRILVCLIEKINENSFIKDARKKIRLEISDTDNEETKKIKSSKIEKAHKILTEIPKNSYCPYFHYLPETRLFCGGIINFRKIETYSFKDFNQKFASPHAQISMNFTKDIIARFSNYYARQGQPDFDFDSLTQKLSM
jgi:hypothetical protein